METFDRVKRLSLGRETERNFNLFFYEGTQVRITDCERFGKDCVLGACWFSCIPVAGILFIEIRTTLRYFFLGSENTPHVSAHVLLSCYCAWILTEFRGTMETIDVVPPTCTCLLQPHRCACNSIKKKKKKIDHSHVCVLFLQIKTDVDTSLPPKTKIEVIGRVLWLGNAYSANKMAAVQNLI